MYNPDSFFLVNSMELTKTTSVKKLQYPKIPINFVWKFCSYTILIDFFVIILIL